MVVPHWRKEYCGLGLWRPQCLQGCANIRIFTLFASLIIAIQGLYLGYMIGILTTIEKRFEIPSAWSGALLSIYDVGHALSVLLVGHYGSRMHQPKWIAGGALLSSIACFGLILPHLIFGSYHSGFSHNETITARTFVEDAPLCQWKNISDKGEMKSDQCSISIETVNHQHAYTILAIFQLVAGIASSPFTTLTYVYVDDNATRKQSPFYMGVMTAMWAYGPALGFGLSSYTTQTWINLGQPPPTITSESPDWIGAWWLGLVILCVLYLIFGVPFVFYPKSLKRRHLALVGEGNGDVELMTLKDLTQANSYVSQKGENTAKWCLSRLVDIPIEIVGLVRNPMFLTLTMSWVMGAYLFGGYSTFLPKYLEVVFHQPTFIANILGGIVGVVGVATSTAIGGKVLTHLNFKASKALIFVALTLIHSLITFVVLMFVSCDNLPINGLMPSEIQTLIDSNSFNSPTCANSANITKLGNCVCDPLQFTPVCDQGSGKSYFSPCFLGCAKPRLNQTAMFEDCACVSGAGQVAPGLCEYSCGSKLAMYMIASFVGGTVGAFFQMALFTNLIWAVPKEKKTNAVALSNFFMSVFGFMPSQVVYGKIFDSTCSVWSESASSCESGYCLLYDSRSLRLRFHGTTSAFQLGTLIFVIMAYFVSRKFRFPNHEPDDHTLSAEFIDKNFDKSAVAQ